MLPSQEILEQVSRKIKDIPNKKGEYKRKVHYGCYLLCSKAGLRISEAIKFDLSTKSKQGLYRITKTKRQKERFVYVSKPVIKELKKSNWQPNQNNRFAFYHFLQKTKREMNISKNIELTPHTLRRSFTTYHAENGMPLPLLQKLLGHSSIRTTALYWRNIHGDNDTEDILAGKKWLENKGKRPPTPITENFASPKVDTFPEIPKNPEPIFIDHSPVISNKNPIQQDNFLSTPKTLKKTPQMSINEISPRTPEKFFLDTGSKKNNQLKTNQPLTLNANGEQKPTEKEIILLAKIRNLEEQLKQTQTECDNLRIKKQKAQQLAQQEKQWADHYETQLKIIKKTFYQWQKTNYHKQLQKEQEIKAQVEQLPSLKVR